MPFIAIEAKTAPLNLNYRWTVETSASLGLLVTVNSRHMELSIRDKNVCLDSWGPVGDFDMGMDKVLEDFEALLKSAVLEETGIVLPADFEAIKPEIAAVKSSEAELRAKLDKGIVIHTMVHK